MRILLIVGPSGAGKDSLLRCAKNHFAQQDVVGFARRYITRAPDNNEDNYYVDEEAFQLLKHNDFFVSSWSAHGKHYGIPKHIFATKMSCKTMICSISRTAINDFELQFDEVFTINITARDDILFDRLEKRGRESRQAISQRLERAKKSFVAKNPISFDNSEDLSKTSLAFIELLTTLASAKRAEVLECV